MTGAELASAPIIAFLDDDAVAEPQWLEELLKAYCDERVLGAGGHIEPLWRQPRPNWFPMEFAWIVGCTYHGMPVRDGRVRNLIGANMSIRAAVLRETGGFASQLGRHADGRLVGHVAESCEETEFCIRAARLHPGGSWAFCPNARVRHLVSADRTTWRYFVRRCRMEGTAKAVLTVLTGSRRGLASERRYLLTLLQAVSRELAFACAGRSGAARRAGAICAGLAITATAYVQTRLAQSWVTTMRNRSDTPSEVAEPTESEQRRASRKIVRAGLSIVGAIGLGLAVIGSVGGRPSPAPAEAVPAVLPADAPKTAIGSGTQGLPAMVRQAAFSVGSLVARRTLEELTTRPSASPASYPAGRSFEIGDKIKLVVYERVDDQEADKWNRGDSGLHGFQERPELSGVYDVAEDGSMTLPLLGPFMAIEQTPQSLQSAVAQAFATLTGHKALATIESVERPPVYVLGPVKNPGSYKYTAGMTVLQAIALAGGYDRRNLEPWQQIEVVREVEQGLGSMRSLPRLLAHLAVLKSELHGTEAAPPLRLQELVGDAVAKQMVDDEVEQRNSMVSAGIAQRNALAASLASAQQEVQRLSNREAPINQLIALGKQHVAAMQSLMATQTTSRLEVIRAQSELAEAEQRRLAAVDQYTTAQQRIDTLEQQRAQFEADTRRQLHTEIAATEEQIRAGEQAFATSRDVLGALGATTEVQYRPPSAGQAGGGYEVVRNTPAGPIALPATGLTVLQPGDLVRIATPEAGADGDGRPQATSSPDSAAAPVPQSAIVSVRDPGSK